MESITDRRRVGSCAVDRVSCPVCDSIQAGRFLVRENVEILVCDIRTGRVQRLTARNLVLNDGLNLLAGLHSGAFPPITIIAVGTDGTAPVVTDTALGTEVFAQTISQTVVGSDNVVRRLFIPTSSANGNTLREALMRNTNNKAISRVTFSDIIKTVSITVTLSWTHTFARA